jgi:Transposase DNA-binding
LGDERLSKRYHAMVEAHLGPAQRAASGIRAVPSTSKAFAATQAAYRFLHNARIRLPDLAAPLLTAAREAIPAACDEWVLVVHDWSELLYRRHHAKRDRAPLSASFPEGYELHTALLVSDRDGAPLAPAVLSLHAADGVHCSRTGQVRPGLSKLDELDPAMHFVERQRLGRRAVHLVDAEADSVAHYRQWSSQADRYYVVRADDRLVEHSGTQRRCSEIHAQLEREGALSLARGVECRREPAEQWIAEADVVLTRPGQQNRPGVSRQRVPGAPLPLRLVIAELRTLDGTRTACWYLLTNLPATVSAATIALWYYWRWRVEGYFKLLKSAGMEVEQWQQTTADAIAKRLLVASMACVVVWQLARDTSPQAEEARNLLIRLSGRQMAWGRPFTTPALLAGLWTLLSVLHALELYDLKTLEQLAQYALPRPSS